MPVLASRVRLLACASLATAALASAPGAQAAPSLTFGPAAQLSADGAAPTNPQIIVGDDGSAAVVWNEVDADAEKTRLKVATRLPGDDGWGVPANLASRSWPTPSSPARLVSVAAGSDHDGAMTVVWQRCPDNDVCGGVYSSTRAAGSRNWSAAELVSPADRVGDAAAALVRSDGSVLAAWNVCDPCTESSPSFRLDTAVKPAGSGTVWGAAVPVEAASEDVPLTPVLASNAAGDATLVYALRNETSRTVRMRAAAIDHGSTVFGAPVTLDTAALADVYMPAALVLPGGGAVAAWVLRTDAGGDAMALRRVVRSSGAWSTAVDAADPGMIVSGPQFAADRRGNVTVFWSSYTGDPSAPFKVVGVRRPVGGSWSALFDAAPTGVVTAFGKPVAIGDSIVGLWATRTSYPAWEPTVATAPSFNAPFGTPVQFGTEVDIDHGGPPVFASSPAGAIGAAWVGPASGGRGLFASLAAAGQIPIPEDGGDSLPVTDPPRSGDAGPPAADPSPLPVRKVPRAPAYEALLAGRTITIRAVVAVRRGARCTGPVFAAVRVSGNRYGTRLKLNRVTAGGARICRADGKIKLRKAPKANARLQVRLAGRQIRARAVTATHPRQLQSAPSGH